MGKDNHNSSSNNKNSLPQTPKALKQTPQQAREEFSREFTELNNTNGKQARKSTNQQNRNKR
ncbi:YfhD family protein [Paenisporosarcina sp. NPDC076898]|uniref:YfhD family protein n=1 Tax=unclassified Paenisporosarcina TaxID=2642018 RepID=UPI003D079BDC